MDPKIVTIVPPTAEEFGKAVIEHIPANWLESGREVCVGYDGSGAPWCTVSAGFGGAVAVCQTLHTVGGYYVVPRDSYTITLDGKAHA